MLFTTDKTEGVAVGMSGQDEDFHLSNHLIE